MLLQVELEIIYILLMGVRMNIDINKVYRTRSGLPVKELKIDDGDGTNYTVCGLVGDHSHYDAWLPNGKYLTKNVEHEFDLIEVE
jgi:hypothetical protein